MLNPNEKARAEEIETVENDKACESFEEYIAEKVEAVEETIAPKQRGNCGRSKKADSSAVIPKVDESEPSITLKKLICMKKSKRHKF